VSTLCVHEADQLDSAGMNGIEVHTPMPVATLDSPESIRVRRYCSPEECGKLGPYAARWWRRQVYAGRIKGAIKPAGKWGRLWIPLDEAQALLRDGPE
jgi:hypothetical protein